MGGSVEEDSNSMEDCQCRQVQSIFALPGEIDVDLVKDAVAKICLLIQRPFNSITLSLREERE